MNPGLSMENKAESNTILFKPKGPISIIFFVLGVCCILLATSGIIISNREGDYDWMNLVWIAMVCMGVYLVVLAFVCRKDFIQVDPNGLHFRGHKNTPWPRTNEWHYVWRDLESFLLHVEELQNEYSIQYPFSISLYDKYGDEIATSTSVGYFDLEEIQAFREVLSQHLMHKTLFDWKRCREISFKMKLKKSMLYFPLCLFVVGFCVKMPAISVVVWLAAIWGVFHCLIRGNDFVTISSQGVKVDLHCGFYRHVKKEVAYKDISFVKAVPIDRVGADYKLLLYDVKGEEMLSCNCVGLDGMDNLDVVLKEIFRNS